MGLFNFFKKKPINKYGWVPDFPDHRDLNYKLIKKVGLGEEVTLPKTIDLRPACPPVENQKNIGSCTAQALVGNLEFLELKDNKPFVDLSRLFIYYNERAMEGTVNSDAGAQIRDGIKTLANQGVCSETLWPYVESKFTDKPCAVCYKDAAKHRITSYYRITNLDDMKHCLASGYPFVFGSTLYESFESSSFAKTGILPMPKPSERVIGGHAMCCVGYDDDKQWVIVRNSWGVDWGIKGYFYMPYEYIGNANLSDDMWTIRTLGGF